MAFTKPQLKKIAETVDALANVKKNIAEAEKIKKPLEASLKGMGEGTYVGTLHEAVVYERASITIDWKAIAAEMGFTEESKVHQKLLTKHTKAGVSICINVNARKQQV